MYYTCQCICIELYYTCLPYLCHTIAMTLCDVIQHCVIVCIVLHSTRFPRFKRVFDSERSRKIVKKKFRLPGKKCCKCLATSCAPAIFAIEAEAITPKQNERKS